MMARAELPPTAEAVAEAALPASVEPEAPAAATSANTVHVDSMDRTTEPAASKLRPVEPIDLAGVTTAPIPTGEPIFERVDPRTLLIEEAYQRDLSPRSLKLIRKIAAEWDWRKFKPPVVAFADGGLRIIDGQHTAMGAASRPDVPMIPVMVVEAAEVQDRAIAFIGHNRDRLAVTPMQMHHAAVAAGDEGAATVEQVCARAGVTLVRATYGGRKWSPGETVAIGAISGVIERRGAMGARQMLQVLAGTELAPIRPDHIKAVEAIFTDPLYANDVETLAERGGEDLAAAIAALGEGAEREARLYVDARRGVPMWKALAMQWFKKMRKRRKAA